MTITFVLSHQIISRTDNMVLASGSKNYVTAQFDLLTEDWTAPITAIFNEFAVVLDEDNQCLVPWEVLANPGKVEVSAFCGDLHTATSVLVPVHPGGYLDGQTPQPPTPDVYAQLAGMVKTAVDTANDVKERADAGEFNGKDAPQIDDTQASPDHPWSGAKVATELGKYAPLESALTVSGIGSNQVSLSPTIAWKMQGMKLFGRTTQDGTPTPDAPVPLISAGEGGSVEVTVSDGAEQSQALTVSTPNGLHGIPVDSGGNFTDGTGQQWICDEVDFERGVQIERIISITFDGSDDEKWILESGTTIGNRYMIDIGYAVYASGGSGIPKLSLNTNFPLGYNVSTWNVKNIYTIGKYYSVSEYTLFVSLNGTESLEEFRKYLAKNHMSVYCALLTPIEKQLPDEVQVSYTALKSYNGTTNVAAQGCSISAAALANPNAYINGLIQRISALEQNAIGG